MDISPDGDTGTLLSFPHNREDIFILFLLFIVISDVNIQLRDIHRHLQSVIQRFHRAFQFLHADIIHIMRLVSVGIDGSSEITQCPDKIKVVIGVMLEGVVVVVDKNGIGIALVGHFKGPDEPVVTRFSTTAQRLLHQGVALLVHTYSFVHHINHGQFRILFLHGIKPCDNGFVAFADRQAVGEPVGVLCSPNESMEFVGEPIFLSIVKGSVASPVETTTCSFYRSPLRFILRGDLVPELVIRIYASSSIHLVPCGDVSKELIGVRRQLGIDFHRGKKSQHGYKTKSSLFSKV